MQGIVAYVVLITACELGSLHSGFSCGGRESRGHTRRFSACSTGLGKHYISEAKGCKAGKQYREVAAYLRAKEAPTDDQ